MLKRQPETPLVTIITVTRNNASGLRATAQSVQSQTFTDIQWLIIDGASTDDSIDYLKTLKAQWLSEPDNGIYDAMNKGINRSHGEYLIFLNAGDTFVNPDTLAQITSRIEAAPALIYGDAIENNHIKHARPPSIKRGMFTHHQAMLYRRASIGNIRFNTKYQIAADYEFTVRIMAQSEHNALYIPIPFCIFECGGLSQIQTTLGRREQFTIRKNLKLCSSFENRMITATQWIAVMIRRFCPALYWRLKSSGNTAPD